MRKTSPVISYGAIAHGEPNHRQELALERIDLAVDQLASVLLSNCRTNVLANAVIQEIREAVGPIVAEILTTD
jgi:hypothetical protein